jgi:hypothetical protein
LDEEPALLAAVGPRFQLRSTVSAGSSATFYVPESPAGRLVRWAQERGFAVPEWEFIDPYEGRGGFGASTAQFALLFQALGLFQEKNQGKNNNDEQCLEAWKLYRQLTGTSEGFPPSGADLIAQWQGGVTLYEPSVRRWTQKWDNENELFRKSIWIFSATAMPGRKTATHEHLKDLKPGSFVKALRDPIQNALQAMSQGDVAAFGNSLDEYADRLRAQGLEMDSAHQDRQVIRQLPGVVGCKGAGAMLSDALVVVVDPSASHDSQREILSTCLGRALSPLLIPLRYEGGIG